MPAVAELTTAVRAVRALFDAAACSCALADDDGAELEFVAADGAGAEEIVGVRIPVSRGIAGWAAMSGQPIALADVQSDARFARDVAESTHYVPTRLLAAPMLSPEGEVVGVVEVLDPQVEAASDWSLAVLGTCASLMAMLATPPGGEAPGLSALGAHVLEAVERFRAADQR